MPVSKVEIDVSGLYSQKMAKLLDMLNDDSVKKEVNTLVGEALTPYVPMETGALRRSFRAFPEYLSWGTGLQKDRAHYQYMGVVYGPNRPITKHGVVVGWYTPQGATKYPTTRSLGVYHEWKGWTFGYTTPGTQSQWVMKYTEPAIKRTINMQATRYLKKECKNRGLS